MTTDNMPDSPCQICLHMITINLREAMKTDAIFGITPEPMGKTPNARLVTRQPLVWGTVEQVIQLNGIKGQRATAIYDKRFRHFHLSDRFQECTEASKSSTSKFTPELETTGEAEDFFSR